MISGIHVIMTSATRGRHRSVILASNRDLVRLVNDLIIDGEREIDLLDRLN